MTHARLISLPLTAFALLLGIASARAQARLPIQSNEEYVRLQGAAPTDSFTRAESQDLARYPFLNKAANRILLNGADWAPLRLRFRASARDSIRVSVVHIGDSHIQGEGATSMTRTLLQERLGNPGRGLITPFKIAGTNQPVDYYLKAGGSMASAKLLKLPWLAQMGFTGVTISPSATDFTLNMGTTAKGNAVKASPFSTIRLFCSGGHIQVRRVTSGVADIPFTAAYKGGILTIRLEGNVTDCTLHMTSAKRCYIAGASLEDGADAHGVYYHAIGNNGATFTSYNRLGTVGVGIKSLQPDLVILSMGANEAFGNISEDAFYQSVLAMVNDIRNNNPRARILLVTPMECLRNKGASVNTKCLSLRNVIMRLGRDHHIPVYDWYEAAGGAGAARKWSGAALLARDGIHHTWAGYQVHGRMLYLALVPFL